VVEESSFPLFYSVQIDSWALLSDESQQHFRGA